MIKTLFIFLVVMRTLPEYFNSVPLYWVLNDMMMITLTFNIFKYGKKSVVNLGILFAIVFFFMFAIVDDFCMLSNISEEYFTFWKSALITSLVICVYVLVVRNRHEWKKLDSAKYNPNRVQAIYSRPNTILTLLGAATSLSPKCSVRYSYNGKMIRFKKGYPTPIMTNTIVKPTDIIENTNIDPGCFYQRYDEIKNRRYNLLNFNCRNIFKGAK